MKSLALPLCVFVLTSAACVSTDQHRRTVRQLEDTKIELAKVESSEILRRKEARQLRAEVNTLKANRRALEKENASLKRQRLQPAQRNALGTLNQLNTKRRRVMSILRTNLSAYLKLRLVRLSWFHGHPLLTIDQTMLFSTKKAQIAKANPKLLTDVLLALKSTQSIGVVVTCTLKPDGRSAQTLCDKRLQTITAQAKAQVPTLNLYTHNRTQGQQQDKDSKRAKVQDVTFKGDVTMIVLTDLSALEQP